ncbi:MAG TPA: signal peptidase I [Holophagaceae bacterium]|jgi:signal peptidase I|nr:signal peptidase I [Holophagaceae bacterium]
MADGVKNLPPGAAKGAIRDNLEVICFAVALILFFKTFVGQQFSIPSGSMRETLMIGDHLLVNKFISARPQFAWETELFPMRKVERGDIIVFRWPIDRDQDLVKRCVALPGDTVEMKDKRLYVNGSQVTGPWEYHIVKPHLVDAGKGDGSGKETGDPVSGPWPENRDGGPVTQPSGFWRFTDPDVLSMDRQGMRSLIQNDCKDNLGPIKVPPDCLMAMGDDRDNSEDSRYWGFVPMDHLRGRPFLVWWSFREGDHDYDNGTVPTGPVDVAHGIGDAVGHFFTRTRWERTGTIPR